MSNILTMTLEEKTRVQMFVEEQKEAWQYEQQVKKLEASRKGQPYTTQEFPGFDEATALQAVRNGWQSKLDKLFAKKRKNEGW